MVSKVTSGVRKEVRKYHTIKVFKDKGIHNKEVQ